MKALDGRLRALVVDDHAVTRTGVRLLLEQLDDVEVVGEAASGEEALQLRERLEPDLLLVDIDMPGMGGVQATRELREADPGVRILILSVHEDEATILEALRAGAAGYLPKSSDLGEFEDAVRTVRKADGVYLAPRITGRVMRSAVRSDGGGSTEAPTVREREILALLVHGLTAKSIGLRLGISERTVNTHVSNLYRRLGVTNRVDAVLAGIRRGLIEPPASDQLEP